MEKINFGKYIAHPVDIILRTDIIDFIYNKLEDLHKFSYSILNNVSKLKFLKNNEHFLSPNFKGLNYFIIFTIINNNKYCIALDRRKLSYSKDQIDIKNLNIFILEVTDISNEIYKNTIFDGKLINNSIFLIQDCYYLMGNNMLNINLNEKIHQLNENIINNINIKNFDFKLNKLYLYENLEELINNLSKLSYSNNGLIFFPKKSGINILFLEKQSNKNKESYAIISPIPENNYNSNDIIFNYTNFLKSREYSYENMNNIKILSLIKTDIPDVYNIYNNINELPNETNKLGIALIPNLKISHMCNSLIKNFDPIKFKCCFSEKFKKWIPIAVV
jgi:hypothetical protein